MDDGNRKLLNDEIARVQEKLKVLAPDSEGYDKVSNKLTKLIELANKDDESRRRFEIDDKKLDVELQLEASKREMEEERLEAEASLEASKRGLESEKLETEARIRAEEAKRSWIQLAVTSGVTLLTFIGTWTMNRISQNQSEYFESTGQAYTSRFSKWLNKEPVHPNPLLRNRDK